MKGKAQRLFQAQTCYIQVSPHLHKDVEIQLSTVLWTERDGYYLLKMLIVPVRFTQDLKVNLSQRASFNGQRVR